MSSGLIGDPRGQCPREKRGPRGGSPCPWRGSRGRAPGWGRAKYALLKHEGLKVFCSKQKPQAVMENCKYALSNNFPNPRRIQVRENRSKFSQSNSHTEI
ncbi:hypothetical protein Hanom_Chr04g00341101 [Helianthus anomalus]